MLITSTLPNGTKISIELEDKYLADIVAALWKDSEDTKINGGIQAIGGIPKSKESKEISGILGLSTPDSERKEIKRLCEGCRRFLPHSMEYTNEKLGVFRLTCTNCRKRLHRSYRLDENGKLSMVSKRQLFGG